MGNARQEAQLVRAKECLARHRNAKTLAKIAWDKGDIIEAGYLEDNAKVWLNAVETWLEVAAAPFPD